MQTEYEPDSKPPSAPPPPSFYSYAAKAERDDSMVFANPSSTGYSINDFIGTEGDVHTLQVRMSTFVPTAFYHPPTDYFLS